MVPKASAECWASRDYRNPMCVYSRLLSSYNLTKMWTAPGISECCHIYITEWISPLPIASQDLGAPWPSLIISFIDCITKPLFLASIFHAVVSCCREIVTQRCHLGRAPPQAEGCSSVVWWNVFSWKSYFLVSCRYSWNPVVCIES